MEFILELSYAITQMLGIFKWNELKLCKERDGLWEERDGARGESGQKIGERKRKTDSVQREKEKKRKSVYLNQNRMNP